MSILLVYTTLVKEKKMTDKYNSYTKDDDLVRQHVHIQDFYVPNVAASGDTAGDADFDLLVQDGYEVSILRVAVSSDDGRTNGTATAKVTVDGTALTNGPEAVIDATNTLLSEARVNPGSVIVAAGSVINVLVTGDGSWTPITANFAVKVSYYLNPVP
jgi:hypothetical protein